MTKPNNKEVREKARLMRAEKRTLLDIARTLHVSQGTVSLWVRDMGVSIENYPVDRRQLSDELLNEVAAIYREWVNRPGRKLMIVKIAEHFGVPATRADSWVKTAKARGILETYVPQQCHVCQSPLGDLPPHLPHHHLASVSRMLENARQLKERCEKMAEQAQRRAGQAEIHEFRMAFHLKEAARHYGALAQTLEDADREVRLVYRARRRRTV